MGHMVLYYRSGRLLGIDDVDNHKGWIISFIYGKIIVSNLGEKGMRKLRKKDKNMRY